MNTAYKLLIAVLLVACGASGDGEDLGTLEQPLDAIGFYGVRDDGANKQRLCAGAPSASQKCLFPANKNIRVKLVTTGMASDVSAAATTWVTAIIDNTFNNPNRAYVATGFAWLQSIHQPKVTIVQGAVDDSLGSSASDIRRYLRLSCNTVSGAMTENPAKNGTYHACNSWTATIDAEKLRAYDAPDLEIMLHHCLAISMLAPAGVGVGTITPGRVTSQTIASGFFLSTTVSDRDLCAMTVFNPDDLTTVNFLNLCT